MDAGNWISNGIAVVALVFSWLAYRRSGIHKSSDLRVALGSAIERATVQLDGLPDAILDYQARSKAFASATGSLGGGRQILVETSCAADLEVVASLHNDLPSYEGGGRHLTDDQLEARIIKVNGILERISAIREKYGEQLQRLEADRARLVPPSQSRQSGLRRD